jgi:hypothetical protein
LRADDRCEFSHRSCGQRSIRHNAKASRSFVRRAVREDHGGLPRAPFHLSATSAFPHNVPGNRLQPSRCPMLRKNNDLLKNWEKHALRILPFVAASRVCFSNDRTARSDNDLWNGRSVTNLQDAVYIQISIRRWSCSSLRLLCPSGRSPALPSWLPFHPLMILGVDDSHRRHIENTAYRY